MSSQVFEGVKCKMHVVMEVAECVSLPHKVLVTVCAGYCS